MANAIRDTDGTRSSSNLQDLVVISGLSGAGKSSAMNVFEDAGYFCVDNLPAEMIRSLSELFMHEGSKVERAAVVCDSRGGEFLGALAGVIDQLAVAGRRAPRRLPHRRRAVAREPLQGDAPAPPALPARQRRRRDPRRGRAARARAPAGGHRDRHVRAERRALRRKVADELLVTSTPGKLAVTFTSFGHKHGPPRDADLAFDVRFLPNPHYDPDLRPLTGFDQQIIDYVGRDGRLDEFYARLVPLLEYLLPQYVTEGKAHLMVAIGCTGGRHRSVAIAEHLASLLPRTPGILRRGRAPGRRSFADQSAEVR